MKKKIERSSIHELFSDTYMFCFCLLFLFSCTHYPPAPPLRQLSEAEKNVKIIQTNQSLSIQLSQKCTILSQIDTFNSKRDIRIDAASNSANVAQILYTSTSTTSTYDNYNTSTTQTISYDVRFYKCKGDFYANL